MDCKNDIINLDDINFNDINFNDINLDDINLVGEMYIGVNDYGFCTGIPYQGELPIDLITFIFYKYLKENVSNISFMGNLEDFIKINFIKLEFNLENLSKCLGQNHPEYLKYIESKKKYDKIQKINKEEREDWLIEYNFFQRKLIALLNSPETRVLLINFIKEHDYNNQIIKLLETDEKIQDIPSNEIIKAIRDCDKTNPYYWTAMYKDNIEKVLRLRQPIPTRIEFTESHVPFNLINSVSKMIPYWLKNNPDMNLYMIRIEYIFDENMMGEFPNWTCFDEKINKLCSFTRIIKPDGTPENVRDKM